MNSSNCGQCRVQGFNFPTEAWHRRRPHRYGGPTYNGSVIKTRRDETAESKTRLAGWLTAVYWIYRKGARAQCSFFLRQSVMISKNKNMQNCRGFDLAPVQNKEMENHNWRHTPKSQHGPAWIEEIHIQWSVITCYLLLRQHVPTDRPSYRPDRWTTVSMDTVSVLAKKKQDAQAVSWAV